MCRRRIQRVECIPFNVVPFTCVNTARVVNATKRKEDIKCRCLPAGDLNIV